MKRRFQKLKNVVKLELHQHKGRIERRLELLRAKHSKELHKVRSKTRMLDRLLQEKVLLPRKGQLHEKVLHQKEMLQAERVLQVKVEKKVEDK